MFELLITSSVLILVILGLRLALRNRVSQRLIYALWLLAALRLLIPASLPQSQVSVMAPVSAAVQQRAERAQITAQSQRPQEGGEFQVQASDSPSEPAGPQPGQEETSLQAVQPQAPDAPGQPAESTVDWVEVLRIVWLAGAAAMLCWFFAVNLAFRRRLRRKAVPIKAAECALPVYWCEEIPSPCLFGLFRPAIYITRFSADEADKLTDVITHELCHWRHGDHIWAAVRCLCVSLYWFNPLVWIAARASRADCELACDEAVIRRLGEEHRIAYGHTLVRMIDQQNRYRAKGLAATTMTAGKKSVHRRIERIVRKPRRSALALTALLLCAAMASACTFTGAPARQSGNSFANPDGQTRLVVASGDGADGWTVLETVREGQSSFVYDCTQSALLEAADDLAAQAGIPAQQAYDQLAGGGYTLCLSIDPELQTLLESVAYDPIYRDSENGNGAIWPGQDGSFPQAAMVLLRYDGSVAAITNGIREKDGAQRSQALRQPGSAFTPLSAYAPALELGEVHYSTLMEDRPLDLGSGVEWPRNFSETYDGPVTLYDALRLSLNTVPARLVQMSGVDLCYDLLREGFGIGSFADGEGPESTDRTLSLSVGNLRNGVSLYELAAAYQVFGNGGVYNQPHLYTHLYDRSGELVLDKTAGAVPVQAVSPQTAYIMNQMLRGTVEDGTGTTMVQDMPQGIPVAAKTGTSPGNTGFWAVGMTPYYLMAVWEGNDDASALDILRPLPTQLAFNAVMSEIHQQLEPREFDPCEGIVQLEFCTRTGLLAGTDCPAQVGFFTAEKQPDRTCDGGHTA